VTSTPNGVSLRTADEASIHVSIHTRVPCTPHASPEPSKEPIMSAMQTNPPDIIPSAGRKSFNDPEPMSEGISAEERVRNLYRKGKEKVIEAEESFESYVRAHPVKSVLVAGGVGLAVGFLLGRRR
jgi:hypothetical protein